MEQNTESHLFELNLDEEAKGYLGETARWGKFFAILGYIMCGLFVILAFFMGALITNTYERMGVITTTSPLSTGLITGLYLGFAIVYFFPCMYLYRFSVKMQTALRNTDQPLLNLSLRNLKSCYKFIGILTIISLGLFVLLFILGIVGSAFH